jgi:hypothetical protein
MSDYLERQIRQSVEASSKRLAEHLEHVRAEWRGLSEEERNERIDDLLEEVRQLGDPTLPKSSLGFSALKGSAAPNDARGNNEHPIE